MSKRRLIFTAATFGLVLLVTELTLRFLTMASARVESLLVVGAEPEVPSFFKDPELGYRPNPEYLDHDAWGFRNAEVPASAQVVVFGDSQTYGQGVSRSAAWPQALARASGIDVYNMAFNGYGPTQSLMLLERASSLEPQVVLQAVYAGNDLFDCWDAVHVRGVHPELKTKDREVLQRVRDAENSLSLRDRIDNVFEWQEPGAEQFSIKRYLRQNCRLYGLARATRATFFQPSPRREWERLVSALDGDAGPDIVFESGDARTVFTAEYRLCALDLDDPRIYEGQRIALDSIDLLQRRASETGAALIVVWIPTKEWVFSTAIDHPEELGNGDYARLIAFEDRFRQELMRRCGELAIEVVDSGPALAATLADGFQPYPMSRDGHPNEIGHSAIAGSIRAALADRTWSAN